MQKIEQKSLNFVLKSLDPVRGIFIGYASAFNKVDWVGDSIDPSAFDRSMAEFAAGYKKIPINFDHDKTKVLTSNLIRMGKDDYGLLVEFQVTDEAKAAFPLLYNWAVEKAQSGTLCMSIGGYVIDSVLGDERDLRYQLSDYSSDPIEDTILEFDLDHIAITGHPVEPGAKVLEVKGLRVPKYPIYLASSWDANAAIKRWRKYSDSEDKPSASYKNAFLYFDSDKTDDFGSYHLPIVDIVDDEPVVNQKAVIAAYQAIEGARNEITFLSDSEKKKAKGIISKLYDKINRARKEEGIAELPEIKKSEVPMGLNDITGAVSAQQYLIRNKIEMSNTLACKFVSHIFQLSKKSIDSKSFALKNESEILRNESQRTTDVPAHGNKNGLDYTEIARLLIKK